MRRAYKRGLAVTGAVGRPRGATVLIYHRVGGGTRDERDLEVTDFAAQMEILADADVVSLDAALARASAGDDAPCVVLTFDDGFADVAVEAWPVLREHGYPFTVYLSTAHVGGTMHWDGSTATAAGPGLTWDELERMSSTGLCAVENHTHTHARPEVVGARELDLCSDLVEQRVGRRPRHFAWTWGVPVPALLPEVRRRFASAATGRVGRHLPGGDRHALPRVPVRRTDPLSYFSATVAGSLLPAQAYDRSVRLAKAVGARA